MKPKPLHVSVANAERTAIEDALYYYDGNVTKAAEALEVSKRVLHRKIAEHDLAEFAARLRAKAGIGGPRH